MRLRDDIERTLRAWDAHETARKAAPVIDFDCAPRPGTVTAAPSRLDVYSTLTELSARAEDEGDQVCAEQLRAHLAYLGAVLGERPPLDDYLTATQGCPAAGWPDEYVTAVGERAHAALADIGIPWDATTDSQLREAEGPIDATDAPEMIQATASEAEPAVRVLADTDAPYALEITTADVDAYWSYWLDGTGQNVRLRFNLRNATFTKARIPSSPYTRSSDTPSRAPATPPPPAAPTFPGPACCPSTFPTRCSWKASPRQCRCSSPPTTPR
nr:hypothetical protein [Pseudofrankia sp. BMG5.36]